MTLAMPRSEAMIMAMAMPKSDAMEVHGTVLESLPNATFHRALNDLLKSGVLINTGSDKRPFYIGGGK